RYKGRFPGPRLRDPQHQESVATDANLPVPARWMPLMEAMRPDHGNETGAACTGFRQQTEQVMSQQTPSHSDDGCTWLPRRRLTHIFRVVSRVDASVSGAIESRIVKSNGRVEQWTMVRRVDVLEHKITVVGLSES